MKNVYKEHQNSLSPLEKFALFATEHVGTMGFFFIIFIWTIGWLAWNTFGPEDLRFDPSPAFVLWLFISNMIQLSLLPLIMIGQNLQNRYTERRSQEDFDINKKSEAEIETILKILNEHSEILQDMKSKSKKI